MENLKQLISKIDVNNPTSFDMRVLSLKQYYLNLRKNKDMKKIKRLKLVLNLYPQILLKNDFRIIVSLVESPSLVTMTIRNRTDLAKFEEHAVRKYYNGRLPIELGIRKCIKFSLIDLYEYFGI